MVSLDQAEKIAAMMTEGWHRATSRRALLTHKIGEPMLMVRISEFVVVMPNGEVRPATKEEITEW